IFPGVPGVPSPPARKTPALWAAAPAAAPRLTPPEISSATWNTQANTPAASPAQTRSRRHAPQAGSKVVRVPWSAGGPVPGATRTEFTRDLQGFAVALAGNVNPYFASVARPASLLTKSKNARAASLFFALFSTMAP